MSAEAASGCRSNRHVDDFQPLPRLHQLFGRHGCDDLMLCQDGAGQRNRVLSCGDFLRRATARALLTIGVMSL